MTVMSHITALLMQQTEPSKVMIKVSRKDYEQWTRAFVFDGLRDLRYGQSFCNHFGIVDHILYYARTFDEADRYIKNTYLK